MSNKTILGSVIGVAVALVVITVLVWLSSMFKEQFKFKKGKIVYECKQTPLPNDNTQTTGTCVILGRSDQKPSTFTSTSECQKKCGTFYTCQQQGIAGYGCIKIGENLNDAFQTSSAGCDAKCNQFNPAPVAGSVSPGTYLIKSFNSSTAGMADGGGAYLVTYFDCLTAQVYPLIDTTATSATADRWTFDNSAGTLTSNKRYNINGVQYTAGTPIPTGTNPSCNSIQYPYHDQTLVMSLLAGSSLQSPLALSQLLNSNDSSMGSASQRFIAELIKQSKISTNGSNGPLELTGTLSIMLPQGTNPYTTNWFLSMDTLSAGRIARVWNQASPQDYACVDSYFPRNDPSQYGRPYTQPFAFCRNVGNCGNLTFVPV